MARIAAPVRGEITGKHRVLIGKETYCASEDGYPMPVKKGRASAGHEVFKQKLITSQGQPPPALRRRCRFTPIAPRR